MQDFLQTFFLVTKETEGCETTLGLILPAMDHLLQEFENVQRFYHDEGNTLMVECIDAGWNKMKKYYERTERSPAYLAATVLDPSCKWLYFENVWEAHWVMTGKKKLVDFWKVHYQSKAVIIPRAEALERPKISVLSSWKRSHYRRKLQILASMSWISISRSQCLEILRTRLNGG